MGKFLLRLAAACLSLGILGVLVVHAALTVRRHETAASPSPPDAGANGATVADRKPARRYRLRMPATKADPHLAKMLAEEAAARAGALRVIEAELADGGAP